MTEFLCPLNLQSGAQLLPVRDVCSCFWNNAPAMVCWDSLCSVHIFSIGQHSTFGIVLGLDAVGEHSNRAASQNVGWGNTVSAKMQLSSKVRFMLCHLLQVSNWQLGESQCLFLETVAVMPFHVTGLIHDGKVCQSQ